MDETLRKNPSPRNRLRAGLCAQCGKEEVNMGFTNNVNPKCCCQSCWQDTKHTVDHTWDVEICIDCPMKRLGPDDKTTSA